MSRQAPLVAVALGILATSAQGAEALEAAIFLMDAALAFPHSVETK